MVDGIQELVSALQTEAYDQTKTYSAEISSIDNEGTVWVYLEGSSMETPTAMTSAEVNVGDNVNVEWRNNKLYIVGNVSNPSAGSIRVTAVEQSAQVANQAAQNAVADASRASEAAQRAEQTAEGVEGIARHAEEVAESVEGIAQNAKASAENASEYAARALGNLSTVQNVTETLNWITAHGTMTLTGDYVASSDTEVVDGKKYYSRTGSGTEADPYVYTLITNPTGDPSQSGYFEGALDPSHVYFVRDNNGDYTVGSYRYSVVTEPNVADISTYYELSIDESLNNYVATHLAVDSEGLWIIPDAGGNKVLISTGQGSTYTSAGTYIIGKVGNVDTVFAKFSQNGMTAMSENGIQIAHLGYGEGKSATGTATLPFFTLGRRFAGSDVGNYSVAEGVDNEASGASSHAEGFFHTTASGTGSHAEGYNTTASRSGSHAEGSETTASGVSSHAEGNETTASGADSHAEGWNTTASGGDSHAEGRYTTASSFSSHAEGSSTTASGTSSHAEGHETTASGTSSHAEGYNTTARGEHSHAQNYFTVAGYDNQTAIGKFNDNQSNNAFEIGNGTSDTARSNAFTVDWSGNVNASGEVTDGSGNALSDLANCVLKATPYFELDTTATSGSDKDIYDALVALGWTDCIV